MDCEQALTPKAKPVIIALDTTKREEGSEMAEKAMLGLAIAAVLVFLIVTSPGWQDVLGFGTGVDTGVVAIGIMIVIVLAWVVGGTK